MLSNQIELPFGRSKRYLHSTRPLIDALVGGWHLNSIASFHTGTPVNIVSNVGYADYPGLRPNLVPGQNPTLPSRQRTITEWFNTAAFTSTPGQSNSEPIPSNAGRNLVRGPGYTNEDFSLFKNFSLPETMNLDESCPYPEKNDCEPTLCALWSSDLGVHVRLPRFHAEIAFSFLAPN